MKLLDVEREYTATLTHYTPNALSVAVWAGAVCQRGSTGDTGVSKGAWCYGAM